MRGGCAGRVFDFGRSFGLLRSLLLRLAAGRKRGEERVQRRRNHAHGNDVSVAVLIEDHGHIRAWLDRPPGGGHDLNVTTTEAEDQFGYAAVRDAPAVVEQ